MLVAGLMLLFSSSAPAVEVLYNEVSSPEGLVANSRTVESASVVTSSVAPLTSGGYSFVEWRRDGVRQQDVLGRAINPFSFTIYESTVVTSVYVSTSADTDADAIPDWYELHFYGNLSQSASSDTDGDGISLLTEYSRDYHPNLRNEITGKGLSWQRSAVITVLVNTQMVWYIEKSLPEGLISESKAAVFLGSNIQTRVCFGDRGGYSFTHWLVNGVRQSDLTGRAIDPVLITVTGATTTVACHVPTAQDGNTNGIPDWFELQFYGSTNQSASSDSDGDGFDLATEYARDYHPNIHNGITAKGLSWQRSAVFNVIASTNYVIYTEKTDPEGLVSTIQEGVFTGTNITTRALFGARGGYEFTCWTVNGVRQDDLLGQAVDPVNVAVTGATLVVAHHLPSAQDSDGDGIPDWYEVFYNGSASQTAQSDADGDGVSLATEYARDYNPNIKNEITAKGLSWQRAAITFVDLQMFERVRYVMTNHVLHGWFSSSPLEFEGTDLGGNTAPGAGDWDGDGDLDIFVGTADGALRVYANEGTRYTMDLSEYTGAFESLVSSWGSLANAYPSLGDWNGDGAADLAVGGGAGWVRIVSSTKKFLPSQHPAVDYQLTISGSTSAIPAFAEVTGDSHLDLLVLLDDGTVRVYPNSGNSTVPFSAGVYTTDLIGTAVLNGTGLSAADVNDDGYTDVLVSGNDGRIWNFQGSESGAFTLNSKVWAGAGNGFASRLTLAAADLDGDNDIDALCGYAEGGLMYLRDPRIGIPSGLQAVGGAGSIQLSWEPNRSYRLTGYYVYRVSGAEGPFTKLMSQPWSFNSYLDTNAPAGVTWHYYVTAASEAYYPGNTVAKEIESRSSETVSADTGRVVLWMPDYCGKAGENAVLQVNVEHGTGISGAGMDIRVTYNPSLLTPLSQVSTNPTVRTTALTENLTATNNAAVANGELRITGSGGTVIGDGHLFDLYFRVASGAAAGSKATNAFSLVTLQRSGGISLTVDSGDTALFTVTASGYFLGDINGDGVLTMDDHALLMDLLKKDARAPSPEELSAGDINGDGKLDHKDIPLMLRLIHGN